MNLISDSYPTRQTRPSPDAKLKAANENRILRRSAGVALSEAVAKEKAVIARLVLGALAGTISSMAAIFTTVIDWKGLEWRNFFVCILSFATLVTFIWMATKPFSDYE
jgi:cell division protein FtsW (lipid II flippase)